jgi:two-component SAPR family response regulator
VKVLIRAIVVDDEQPAVDNMVRMLKESDIVEVRGAFTDSKVALESLKNTLIDVVFIDIEMPDLNGMEMSKKILEIDENIAIVFTTAYRKYAVEAFRLDAMDYLMKPIDKKLLNETLNRVIQRKNIKVGSYSNRIYCFDKFKVINERGKVKFRTAKAEELFAFFIDKYGVEVSRNEIIDQIWSEFDGDKAIDNFNSNLYYMKKALLKNGFKIEVERNKDKYKLNMNSLYCDYFEFISFISSEKSIKENTIIRLEEAVNLYKGDYLKGNDYSWAERNRLYLKEKYINLVLKLSNIYNDLKENNKKFELLKIGLSFEPLHEELNAMLISSYIVSGDIYSAMKQYNLYRKKLKNELGIEPNLEIKKIIRKVR